MRRQAREQHIVEHSGLFLMPKRRRDPSLYLFDWYHHNKQQLHLMVMDGASAHRTHSSDWPATVISVILPPYRPELNPCERVWQVMRKAHA